MRSWVIVLIIAAACGSHSSKLDDRDKAPPKEIPLGLDLQLSNGAASVPAFDHATLAPAKQLGEADVAALLARAKPLEAAAGDAKVFALRPASQPPPRTGATIAGSFPPDPQALLPPASSAPKLTVVRWMPEGQVPIAAQLSITFNQPMVAVTSQEDAAAVQPVRLTPTPKGKWRWIGTRTIVFAPEVRFPQATTYQVEIPAGTKSATGGVLDAAVKFSFETPPPMLIASMPSSDGPQRRDVPIYLLFDQKIDAQAMLAHVEVLAGGKPRAVRMLDAAELKHEKALAATIDEVKANGEDGRWLALRTRELLPAGAQIIVNVQEGAPSAEGPNKTPKPQTGLFKTFDPLKLVKAQCGWNDICRPGMAFSLELDNAVDVEKFDEAMVTLTPDVADKKIRPRGNRVVVSGHTQPNTRYTVTLASRTPDEFGQTLGTDTVSTFTVGDAEPAILGLPSLVILDPEAKTPHVDLFTRNYDQLAVKIYKVTPEDYFAYFALSHGYGDSVPGTKISDAMLPVKGVKNELAKTEIDLAGAMSSKGLGHAIVIVEPAPWKQPDRPPRSIAWVESTRLGIDAHADNAQLVAFASELATGKPASGVAVELLPYHTTATTDAQGLASLALVAQLANTEHGDLLVARRGDDVAFLTKDEHPTGFWSTRPRLPDLTWYVIDDRKLYRPGEDVSIRGWLRFVDPGHGGDVRGVAGAVTSVDYIARDRKGSELGKGSIPVSPVGGFDLSLALPKTPGLGRARISFTAHGSGFGGDRFEHEFRIEEFRRPEFEVGAKASQGPFVVGGGGDVTVTAKYYAGGPLAGADVDWRVSASETSYTPPNRSDYTFGNWRAWWADDPPPPDDDDSSPPAHQRPHTSDWSWKAKTDATGAHVMHLDFLSLDPALPMSVRTTAQVMDVNRQAWVADTTLIVHPSSLYVGIKSKKPFVEKGKPFELDVVGVDLDGKPAPGAAIDVRAVRVDESFAKGKYVETEVDPQTCSLVAAKEPGHCAIETTRGGTYRVTATIVDPQGRKNTTALELWASGGPARPSRIVEREHVQLIPDKQEYAPTNTAEIMMIAPFYPAQALVSWRRSGIVKTELVQLDGPTKVLTVPITDAMTPNLYVHVDLVGVTARLDANGAADPRQAPRPAYAVGEVELAIPPKHRTLAVVASPAQDKVAPGETTSIALEVRDAAGKPVAGADAAVIVVDESILTLAGYKVPAPIDAFYATRSAATVDSFSRRDVKLDDPDATRTADVLPPDDDYGSGTAMALDEGKMGRRDDDRAVGQYKMQKSNTDPELARLQAIEQARNAGILGAVQPGAAPAIAIRSNFNPLAAFSPQVTTDADGKATVKVVMPDNLTRYRIIAVATLDKQFGEGESAVTARLPLMVRPSAPRFLNFGDTFKLPVVLQNQTDAEMTVRVAVRATNAALADGAGREVTVPPNDRVEVQFAAAAELAGTARFQVVGAAGDRSDAAEVALPVWTPATTEAFATYGVIDEGAIAQPVALPDKVVTQFGGLEVTTASTNLQALTDALLYLVHYPFECAEQRSSRIIAIAALRDVLAAFDTKDMPTAAAMEASVTADLAHLAQMQNSDGGFAFWERGRESEPYLSVYVTSALWHARKKGFAIEDKLLARAESYLADIESHYDVDYPPSVRWAISAYALYTRKQLGDDVLAKAQHLLAEAGGADKLEMETAGWLLGALAGDARAQPERKAILRHVLNRVSETAGAANFTTDYGDGAHLLLASDARVDAILLESLIQEQKDSDLIPKLVTGLLGHRKSGRWVNTQENSYALLALDLYFQTYEKVTPDFVARVWLGADFAGELAFKGRSTSYFQIAIPMADVASHDKQNLTIQKDGKGRLYYRVGMTYAPASLALAPADYGFVVTRRYEAVDDPHDVTRGADGVWHVVAGARVRVTLSLVNDNRRYQVALVDPLPAGLEPMNPELATTGPIPRDPKVKRQRWWFNWYDHQEMRDERVEAFAAILWEGAHDYAYVARATTPGNFVVPPPKAEEMYMPETFGRGASDRVIVE